MLLRTTKLDNYSLSQKLTLQGLLLRYKACTKSTSQYYFVLQSLLLLLQYYFVLVKACTKYFPVLLRLQSLGTQYYFMYYKASHKVPFVKYYFVLAQSTCYFVLLLRLRRVLLRTTRACSLCSCSSSSSFSTSSSSTSSSSTTKLCTKHFPSYYFVLQRLACPYTWPYTCTTMLAHLGTYFPCWPTWPYVGPPTYKGWHHLAHTWGLLLALLGRFLLQMTFFRFFPLTGAQNHVKTNFLTYKARRNGAVE